MCVLILIQLAMIGCTHSPNRDGADTAQEQQRTLTRYSFARVMMGSRCEITIEGKSESATARAAGLAFDEIKRIEWILSDYNPDAEIMTVMQRAAGVPHPISQTLLEVLLLTRDIHNASDGAFDPSVGALTHLWRRAAKEQTIPTQQDLHDGMERVGFGHLTIDPLRRTLEFDQPGMVIDFGGIGKGYAAHRAITLLRDLGYPVACVNLGGDLHLGDPPSDQPSGWRVEIVTGLGESRMMSLHNTAVATSGDLERYYEHDGMRYSHIIDPRTGLGLTVRRAATVIAPDGAVADALASAVSVMGAAGKAQLERAYPGVSIRLITRSLRDE